MSLSIAIIRMLRRRPISTWALLALLALLGYYYYFQGTIGTYRTLPWNTEFYDAAAEGFRLGQLHLAVEPSPLLLAQPNPYDPVNRALWMWDAVLWNGHYYIYWGPVPALCLLAFKLITRSDAKVFDQWLVLVFMLGRMLAGGALLWALAGRMNRRVPVWGRLLAIAVFALGSPTPFVMARPVIYEASVAAGQCFLYVGLLAAFWAVALPARRTLLAVLAGTCWGLGLNSRVTLILVVPLLAAISAWYVYRRSGRQRVVFVQALFAFGVPIALSLLACGAYNYARFGSATDFGIAHQLTGRPFTSSAEYTLPNLVSYLTAGLDWTCTFPFVQVSVHRALSDWIRWPLDYDVGAWIYGERVSGLWVATPWTWLALLLVTQAVAVFYRRRQLQRVSAAWSSETDAWAVCCGFAILPALVPALGAYTASMRYLEDVSGGMLLVASIAGFGLLRRTWYAPQLGVKISGATVFTGLALVSLFIGVCLGFTGFTENFPRQNPTLYMQLLERWSLCTPVAVPLPPPMPIPPMP